VAVISSLPSEADVRVLVYDWYRKLDAHAATAEYLPLLDDACQLVFPEATLVGKDGFAAWYQGGAKGLPGVINLFFDEIHELKRVDIALHGNDPGAWSAELLLVVKWEARRWTPPQPKSAYLRFDAWQRWTLRLATDGRLVIREYIVDRLEKLQGSADL
jgi:hypothetical protein